MVITFLDESSILIKIDSKIYNSHVIHKCFYWYGDKFLVDIECEGEYFMIKLAPLSKEWNIENTICKIKTDLIDYNTREIILNETKNIREILIAKAFANGDEFDELPPGQVNDPIGFEPSKI